MTTKAMLIYNPTAGQMWSQFQPEAAKEYLEKHDWDVTLEPTQRVGGGTDLARKAVEEQFNVVLVAGGDGTINEAIQSLAHSNVKLGIIPVGTTNVLARELKIPLNDTLALEYLPIAKMVQVDLGRVNQHYFLLMAGIGFDAELVQEVNTKTKNVAGIAAFVTAGVRTLFQHKPIKMKLLIWDASGKQWAIRRKVMQVFVSNTATYGTDFKIAEEAKFDDGLLELHIFKTKRYLQDTFQTLMSFLLHKHKEWTDMEHYTITKVDIKSQKPCPVQVDGEPITYTPVRIEVVPGALYLLKPKLVS